MAFSAPATACASRVQLIDASTDAHLWAENYDRELSAANIFAIQSEVAAAIADALRASLTAGEQARVNAIPTQSLDAWKAYQLGKQAMAKRSSAALAAAEGHFRKAISVDPEFALAWAGLADTLMLQTAYSGRPQSVGLGEAEQAVARALELDPNLAEAWTSAAAIASDRLQLDRADQMFRRAIALNPNYAPAHHWLGMNLANLGGRDAEALAAAERAVMLDPLSAVMNSWLGQARANIGRLDDALVAFGQAIEIDPTMAGSYSNAGGVYAYGWGRWDSAVPWYEKAAGLDPGDPNTLTELANAYWHLGDDAEARRWLVRALDKGEGIASTNLVAALLYLNGGDAASARRYALKAAELGPWPRCTSHALTFSSPRYTPATSRS